MGFLAWLILLAASATLAAAAQFVFFRNERKATDFDWVYIAGGALLGGFTANVWNPGFGPVVDGMNLLPALLGEVVLGALVGLVYRVFIRPRQTV